MALDDIYVKTDKGSEEVSHRRQNLNHRLRTMLIMVDGVRPAHELIDAARRLGLDAGFFEELLRDGYISLRKAGSAELPEAEEAHALGAAEDADQFLRAQKFMNDLVLDKLGSIRGYGLMVKLQAADSLPDLQVLAKEFVDALSKRITAEEAKVIVGKLKGLLGKGGKG
ncbi:MAG: hypothetical protein HYZ17_09960 [Betaproteobacteria bacterium]|nr:hypothetical protein [Betaproteobacteria bacterium]